MQYIVEHVDPWVLGNSPVQSSVGSGAATERRSMQADKLIDGHMQYMKLHIYTHTYALGVLHAFTC